jgi:hypothetical protein
MVLLWALVGLSGCNRDGCRDKDCGDFGSCTEVGDEGVCVCETGYEQDEEDRCSIKSTTKYLGTWQVNEMVMAVRNGAVDTFSCSYQVEIQESDADVRRVRLTNFPDLSCFDTAPISCQLLVEGSAFTSLLNLRGISNGISYCDDQGMAVSFSGFQISGLDDPVAQAEISAEGDTMTLGYRLAYTLDQDQNGTRENYRFDSEATFTRP